MMTDCPVHQHDCEDCVFVGADKRLPGEPQCNQVDMYVHINPSGRVTAIRRYGSEGANYGSMCADADIPKYNRVIDAWRLL